MTSARLNSVRSPAAVLALLLGAAVVYAATASGAIETASAARVETALGGVALFGLAALLFRPELTLSTTRTGWAGIGLLSGFAIWTGASFAWTIDPDGTWVQLNRAIAYLLAALAALVVGSNLPRARERVALGYLTVAAAVALYALGGKAIPWFHIPGVLDLNQTGFFSRLRAPLGYWNALGLFCVLAVPVAVQAGADPRSSQRRRDLSLVALLLLLVTLGLTYSRGGVAAAVVALAIVLASGPDRLQAGATVAAAAVGAAPALVFGFTRDALTTDQLPLRDRSVAGALFTLALLAGLVVAMVVFRALTRRAASSSFALRPPAGWRGRVAAVAAAVVLLGAYAAFEAGAGGQISQGFESFKSVKYERQNDPARILQASSGNRWVWWNEALGAWSAKPVMGWGAGSFPLLHLRYRRNRLEVLQPHSVPLEWLAELGVIGAALGLAALALLGTAAVSRLRSAADSDARYGIALLSAVGAWFVHMWFDWDWDIPGVALPLMVFLGTLIARRPARPANTRHMHSVGLRSASLALGTLVACGIAASAALPALAAGKLEAARADFAAGNFDAALRQAQTAARLNPLSVDPLLMTARIAGRQARFDQAAAALRKATRRQPDNPDVWFTVARFELVRADVPAVVAAAGNILRLDPLNPFARFFYFAADQGVRSATATGTPLAP